MIIKFKVKNFLSFKDDVLFDLRATKDKKFEDYGLIKLNNDKIINLALIYGPNASGKSNFLKALAFLKNIINFRTDDKNKKIDFVIPFLFGDYSKNNPSEFEIIFHCNGLKYNYCLKINSSEVVYESLKVYLTNRPTSVFERITENGVSKIKLGNLRMEDGKRIDSTLKRELEIKCLKNISFFAAYSQLNFKIDNIDAVIKCFDDENYVYIEPEGYEKLRLLLMKKILVGNLIHNDEAFKNSLLDFLKYADINIANLKTEKKEIELKEQNKKVEYFDISYLHKAIENGVEKIYALPENLESKGTLKFLDIISLLFLLPGNGKVFIIDEIENSIHPLVLKYIIKKFIRERSNTQLIATTHYDGLLECEDILRKDSIWFMTKRKNASSHIYSLSDFNGLNRISSLQKAYEYGRFGAIPEITDL
ncbi:MAG: ATP-binding protein [Elusimicrobiota bacterium]